MFLPMEMIEKCVNSQIWVVNKNSREFVGLLMGFDDYLSMYMNNSPFF